MLGKLANIVRNVGKELLAIRNTAAAQGSWEGSQLKTEADRQAHRRLVVNLGELDPHLPVVSEEDTSSHGPSRPERYFLIDPIDGTASFAGGFDGYVTQVALMEAGNPVMAAIHAPAFDHLFLAERGKGATLNGEGLAVNPKPESNILIDNTPKPRGSAREAFEALSMTGYVECGGISLKICRIADGTADMFFKDVTVRDWDIAAPNLIISEAGGTLRGLNGEAFEYAGGYEKPGVIAAQTLDRAETLAAWIATR